MDKDELGCLVPIVALLALMIFIYMGVSSWRDTEDANNTLHGVVSVLPEGEYSFSMDNEGDAKAAVKLISKIDTESLKVGYETSEDSYKVFVQKGDSSKEEISKPEETSLPIKVEIVEHSGKKYKVTIEEIDEDSAKTIAEQAVDNAKKSEKSSD